MKVLHLASSTMHLRKYYLPVCLIVTLTACKHKVTNAQIKNEINYIEIYYMPPHEMVSYKYNCEKLVSGALPEGSERDYLKITDENYLSRFESSYHKLSSANTDKKVDARFQLLVHFQHKTDTICMGTGHGIIVNGKLKEDSREFAKLVNDEVVKNYVPRFMRKDKN